MRLTFTMNTTIMIRYQRTWNRQIEIKQNRVKKKLTNKIKRIVQMNVNIHLQNMNAVIDSFCDNVEDLESKKESNRFVDCQESVWLFDKKILFLIMNIRFLFVENHRQCFHAWDHFHWHFLWMHHFRSQYLSSRHQRSCYQRSRYQRSHYLHSLYLHSRHLSWSHFSFNRISNRLHCRSRRDHRQNCHLNMRISRSRS